MRREFADQQRDGEADACQHGHGQPVRPRSDSPWLNTSCNSEAEGHRVSAALLPAPAQPTTGQDSLAKNRIVDLLAHRQAHVIHFKEAAAWSAVWVSLTIIFGVAVFLVVGTSAGVEYTTAWLLEKSLSVDNLFVFALIFGYFKVPRDYQHRVLFLGVLGALVFRPLPRRRRGGGQPLHRGPVRLRRHPLLEHLQDPQGGGRQLRPGQEHRRQAGERKPTSTRSSR